jgi:two-component system chemotaxis response regulator CheB
VPLNVLIVDDSPTTRMLLREAISATSDLRVVGEAVDGIQAVKLAAELRPNVILMDLIMPGMDGLAATREIMHDTPTPIVMTSASLDTQETNIAFRAIQAGALTTIRKPDGPRSPGYESQVAQLVSTLRAMAGVQVIHHWKRPDPLPAAPAINPTGTLHFNATPEIIGIASSTGGPAALNIILQNLPADFKLPIVIAQHISADFVPSLVSWLKTITALDVSLARAGDRPRPGSVYLAPGDMHLSIGHGGRFVLDQSNQHFVPSANVLLSSMAHHFGPRAIGIVLTGMGDDGARGLRAMYDKGAFTIAQDEATSVVYGMPQQALLMGAVRKVLPISAISPYLVKLIGAGEPTL